MSIRPAEKTKALIESAQLADNGIGYARCMEETLKEIQFGATVSGPRRSLGASSIGSDCVRSAWYEWRWSNASNILSCENDATSARMMRLLNRGHLEEARLVALFKQAGIDIYHVDDKGKQFGKKDFNGHFKMYIDGFILGCPDVPDGSPVLLEFKTHSHWSFTPLQNKGLIETKNTHYIQMQMYMGYFEFKHGLYVGVNKNNDDIEMLIVDFDEEIFEQYKTIARMLIEGKTPKRIKDYGEKCKACKFCNYKEECFSKKRPARNCRTCTHGRPGGEGVWVCDKYKRELNMEAQIKGCKSYKVNSGFIE